MISVVGLLSGAVAMAYGIASIFFLRFWKRSRDKLFLYFAVAFAFLAINQVLSGILGRDADSQAALYSVRLVAFLLIISGIIRKNMKRK